MSDLMNKASKNFEKYLREFLSGAHHGTMVPKSRLTDQEWEQLNSELVRFSVKMTPYTQDGHSYMKFVFIKTPEPVKATSKLREQASKNFERHLQDFLSGKHEPLIPRSRLSASEWELLNYELAKDSVEMVPYTQEGRSYMRFKRIDVRTKSQRLLLANKMLTLEVLVNRFEQISGVSGWEYKSTSGLGFEHIRLKIDGMSKTENDKIIQLCKNHSMILQVMDTNKGRFLYFDISNARNVSPDNYTPNNKIKQGVYNDSSVDIKESDKDKIEQILDIDHPRFETDVLSEPMQKHTKMIIKKYSELGLVDLKQIHQFAEDIRQNLIAELANNDTIAKQIIGWASLKTSDKQQLVRNLNYITGSQRIDHTGKSIVIMGPNEVTPNGHFRASAEKEFMFNNRLLSDTFDRCFSTIVHENIHRFQNQGLSAIPLNVVKYMNQIYTEKPYKHYFNNLIECESRYIQAFVMRDFSRDFIQYYNKKQMNNILSPIPKDDLWDR